MWLRRQWWSCPGMHRYLCMARATIAKALLNIAAIVADMTTGITVVVADTIIIAAKGMKHASE